MPLSGFLGAAAFLGCCLKFYQRGDSVMVEAEIHGLPRTGTNFFAFHIHEGVIAVGKGFPLPAPILTPAKICIQTMPGICLRCRETAERHT